MLIKEYWNLIGQEPFLAITWEPDFSQACSFHRMLMNHKNFDFTQIPDKTNDVIFLKSPKTMFLGHFWTFFALQADGRTDRPSKNNQNSQSCSLKLSLFNSLRACLLAEIKSDISWLAWPHPTQKVHQDQIILSLVVYFFGKYNYQCLCGKYCSINKYTF